MEPPNQGLLKRLSDKAETYHGRAPWIKKIPLQSVSIILLLIALNIAVWVGCGIVLHFNSRLASSAVLSYTLGLRHALDADHISAIDLMTRKLVASGARPVTVGTFFSLGHSTVVMITALVTAAATEAILERFNSFSRIGNIIGTSASAAFMIILGVANTFILYNLIQELRRYMNTGRSDILEMHYTGGGFILRLLKKLFRLVDRPWKMYPIGFLFGLGFDTSSEIALLGLASIQAAKGTSIWLILIFPVLFTAGMCLLDTTDGALMMALYTRTVDSRDPFIILYSSIILTTVTVLVALIIGLIQIFTLAVSVSNAEGGFADAINTLQDNWDIVGGSICGLFIIAAGLATLFYKTAKQYTDRHLSRECRTLQSTPNRAIIEDTEAHNLGAANSPA